MSLSVIIASLGRPEAVRDLLERLQRQTRPPDQTLVVVTTKEDAPDPDAFPETTFILSPKGTCIQRNTGLSKLKPDTVIVVFFDDDFVPAATYLEDLEKLFAERSDIAGATGVVLKDGVKTAAIPVVEADAINEQHATAPGDIPSIEKHRPSLYGCNMAFRRSAIDGLEFDERLPLYGWLEDIDYSARARKRGALIETGRLTGVHCGVKGGRTSGVRLGYSQMSNPAYLYRKKSMTLHHAADNIVRNFLSNHARVLVPEPHIDRWGRVKGNWLAIVDMMRGRLTPERILEL